MTMPKNNRDIGAMGDYIAMKIQGCAMPEAAAVRTYLLYVTEQPSSVSDLPAEIVSALGATQEEFDTFYAEQIEIVKNHHMQLTAQRKADKAIKEMRR